VINDNILTIKTIPQIILNIIVLLINTHLAKDIKPYIIVHKIIKAGNLTVQLISELNHPPGDVFHAIRNATSFKINKIMYFRIKVMSKPKGSVNNSNITLYLMSFH